MVRDFSENAYQQLKTLTKRVEDGSVPRISTWGMSWTGFFGLIASLGVQLCLDLVDRYHDSVIRKNFESDDKITRVFENVNNVCDSFTARLDASDSDLNGFADLVRTMAEVVEPEKGLFNPQYVGKGLADAVNTYMQRSSQLQNIAAGRPAAEAVAIGGALLKERLKLIPGGIVSMLTMITGAIGGQITATGSWMDTQILDNLREVVEVAHTGTPAQSADGFISKLLEMAGKSVKVENGIYDFLEQKLHPYEGYKLSQKFGKGMAWLSAGGSALEMINEGIDSARVFTNGALSGYEKAAQGIDLGKSVMGFGGSVYIAKNAGSKTLEFVSKWKGNQILATELPELKLVGKENISKAATVLAVGDVVASTFSAGVRRAGEVLEDGTFDWTDASSVGIHGSLSGLNAVAGGLTFGLVDFDSEGFADNLENEISEFVRGDSAMAEFIRDEDNNTLLRVGASMAAGTGILIQETGEAIGEGVETVAGWLSDGWDAVTGLFD